MNNRVFNNADSFAMAFDEAWGTIKAEDKKTNEKLEIVLNKVKDHPFFQTSPSEAKDIAHFRLKLLKLK